MPGAHAGKGLGNKFLDDARQADVLIHVIDASGSTDNNGRQVREPEPGDPAFDIQFVEEEFDLWLESIIGRDWSKTAREAESQGQKAGTAVAKRLSGLAISEQTITNAVQASGLASKNLWHGLKMTYYYFAKCYAKRAKPFVMG